MIVKDSMVLIHLAKITLLDKSCSYFRKVIIPQAVFKEITLGSKKGYEDAEIINNAINAGKLTVKTLKNDKSLKQLRELNIKGGEAEAVSLYWQEKADYLASDDDNLRRKKTIINIKIIGTPAIILKLYKEKMIDKEKLINSLAKLKTIGWFSNSIIDKVLMEAEK